MEDVASAYRVGPRPISQRSDTRRTVVKLRSRELRNEIIQICKSVKPTDLYINENLTPTRSRIVRVLRQQKRCHAPMIAGCGSMGGRVYVWIKPSDSTGKSAKFFVNTWNKLQEFCEKILKTQLDELQRNATN